MINRNIFLISTALSLVFLFGCGGVAKMVSLSAKLGREVEQLSKMSKDDVIKKADLSINLERIKSDPDGILGQYVSITGKADLEGSKDFPLQGGPKTGRGNEGTAFILDNALFVISVEPLPWLKSGDMVTVIGLVSETRFLKEIREMYPKESMPDLVTVIAKDVKKSDEVKSSEPASSGSAKKQ